MRAFQARTRRRRRGARAGVRREVFDWNAVRADQSKFDLVLAYDVLCKPTRWRRSRL